MLCGPASAATKISVGCDGPSAAGFRLATEVGLWVALVFIDGSSDAVHLLANAVITASRVPDTPVPRSMGRDQL